MIINCITYLRGSYPPNLKQHVLPEIEPGFNQHAGLSPTTRLHPQPKQDLLFKGLTLPADELTGQRFLPLARFVQSPRG